ncbi:MAG TPA: hypothetical protein VIW47_04420, partial [Nitrospiraceae bacterium]
MSSPDEIAALQAIGIATQLTSRREQDPSTNRPCRWHLRDTEDQTFETSGNQSRMLRKQQSTYGQVRGWQGTDRFNVR